MQFSVFAGDSMFNCICRNITDMYIKVINNCDVFEHVVKKKRKKKMVKMQLVFFLELK